MIERLLAAERALETGQLEIAERLYAQVEAADPRNAIAMTGRAKVAQTRGDLGAARRHVSRALETDPDDPVAQALAASLREPATAAAPAAPGATAPPEATSPRAADAELPGSASPAAGRHAGSGSATVPNAPGAGPAPRHSILRSIGRFLRSLVGR